MRIERLCVRWAGTSWPTCLSFHSSHRRLPIGGNFILWTIKRSRPHSDFCSIFHIPINIHSPTPRLGSGSLEKIYCVSIYSRCIRVEIKIKDQENSGKISIFWGGKRRYLCIDRRTNDLSRCCKRSDGLCNILRSIFLKKKKMASWIEIKKNS